MPSKNEIKVYKPGAIYHLYNRGVEKRLIFLEDQDYSVFLSYLKDYLLPRDKDVLRAKLVSPQTFYKDKIKIANLLQLNNFSGELTLLAYTLMPNHFHFLVQQKSVNIIDKFMNSLIARYSMFINKKYKRVGPLFQGVYKGVIVESEIQLKHLSRYIHLQSILNKKGKVLRKPFPSSYQNYLGKFNQPWVNTEKILDYFNFKIEGRNSYREFVESQILNDESEQLIDKLKLEN